MPALQWDRLMETCLKQKADMVLAPGSPPQLRVALGLAPLQIPPLDQKDLEEMVESFQRPPAVTRDEDRYQYQQTLGYKFLDVTYRLGEVFRLAVFGAPSPTCVILMRLGVLSPQNKDSSGPPPPH